MAEEILVSAAASLTDAFERLGDRYAKQQGVRVRFNFAASGALVQQIRAGAPVDVFASASPKEVDDLERAGRLEPATRADFAGNRVVLIVPVGAKKPPAGWADLGAARRVSIGRPEAVPAGRYAKEVLESRGLWGQMQGRLALAANVRQALAYVASGDADAGIVFATDVRAARGRVRVVAAATPGRDHDPVRYTAAVVRGSRALGPARRFVRFLAQPDARRILADFGFTAPPGASRA